MSEERTSNGQNSKSWLGKLAQAFSDEPKDREELLELLRNAEKSKLLDSEALAIIEGALQVADLQAKDIMIPRPQMITVSSQQSLREIIPEMIESAHSRFPVMGEKPDEILGILLAKDLLPCLLSDNLDSFDIQSHLRPATFVPESKRLNILLKDFRDTFNHMAIVVDEYGGVAGLVTIEDVLEQIVGEIEDEFDADDEDDINIRRLDSERVIVKALTPIDEFNEYFRCAFSEDEFDTIGGIVTHSFERLPKRDESIEVEGFLFHILNADNRRIRLIQVSQTSKPETE